MRALGSVTVGELVAALEHGFPSAWAEEWDRVGLISGAADASVTGVLVTLDATAEAVERAAASGANVLVTHHPPYLEEPQRVEAGPGPSGTLEAALRLGVAVISLHTNLDRSPDGASALAAALELFVLAPLETSAEPVVLIVTYAPADAIPKLQEAMAAAGAGRLGSYERCSFTLMGTGSFRALEGAEPAVVDPGTGVDEIRLEMMAPPALAERILDAARAVHPYEEPVIVALPGTRARGAARLGRLCAWRDGMGTLGELAKHVSAQLGVSVRVWGDESRVVRRVALANGSAGSLIHPAVIAADALIAGEVRYHDALAAVAAGLAVIEAGHDSTEWPMIPVLAEAVREAVAGTVEVTAEHARAGWWTMEAPNVRG